MTTPLMQIQDFESAWVVLVTTREPTPVLEGEALQADLRRAALVPMLAEEPVGPLRLAALAKP